MSITSALEARIHAVSPEFMRDLLIVVEWANCHDPPGVEMGSPEWGFAVARRANRASGQHAPDRLLERHGLRRTKADLETPSCWQMWCGWGRTTIYTTNAGNRSSSS